MDQAQPPLLDLDQLHVRLLHAGSVQLGSYWNERERCDGFWRLYLNAEAGAEIRHQGRRLPLAPGQALLIPALTRFATHTRSGIRHGFVHFELVNLPAPVVAQLLPEPVTLAADPVLEALLALAVEPGATPVRASRGKALVFHALAALFARLQAPDWERLQAFLGGHTPVAHALAFIEEHLDQALPNPALARRCGLGTDRFIRQFRRHVGMTPARYLRQRRMAIAAQRLLFSEATIDEVAAAVGFSNRFHFTRVFTATIGQPPASYRRRGPQ